MARILVLGGAGHIGAAIARHFDDAGHVVLASGRAQGPRASLQDTTVQYLVGDDTETPNLATWSDGVDLIVDCATPYPILRRGPGPRSVVATARRRMRGILDLARDRDAALVHVSSFTTLPATGTLQDRLRLATIRGMHPYFEVKERVEQDVLGALRSGLKGCVVNPAACFGPYDTKPAEQAYIPMLMQEKVAGTVGHPINVIDVRDVAACVGAAVNRGFPCERLPLLGHNIRVDELTRHICALAGVAPPTLRATLSVAIAGSYWTELAAAIVGRDAPWPSLPVLLTAAGRAMEQSPEQRALGVPLRPLSETLIDAINWYRSFSVQP